LTDIQGNSVDFSWLPPVGLLTMVIANGDTLEYTFSGIYSILQCKDTPLEDGGIGFTWQISFDNLSDGKSITPNNDSSIEK
jgi:hypothetical protein